MKASSYVKKYKLNVNPTHLKNGVVEKCNGFDHQSFAKDMGDEFKEILVREKPDGDYRKFQKCVQLLKNKWDGIENKSYGKLPEKLWSFIFREHICSVRDAMFPEKVKVEA